jgi:hypothetical protein
MLVAAIGATLAAQPADRAIVGDRFRAVTRESAWTEVARIPMTFPTFHPQGMVRIGDTLFVSSVEVKVPTKRYATPVDGYDRDPGAGVGHLFKIDLRTGRAGTLLASTTLGEGAMYHPGGVDFDGTSLWVPVAEYRPDSRTIVYRVDPQTMKATEVFRFADHVGALAFDTDTRTLHGVSWGSRRFYRWQVSADGRVADAGVPSRLARLNPSHYVDYQDCHFAGGGLMLCGGVTVLRPTSSSTFRLGGLELVDLAAGRPVHQVPIQLWLPSGLVMTENPVWIDATASGLRAYFMPEDDRSTIYVYDVKSIS